MNFNAIGFPKVFLLMEVAQKDHNFMKIYRINSSFGISEKELFSFQFFFSKLINLKNKVCLI